MGCRPVAVVIMHVHKYENLIRTFWLPVAAAMAVPSQRQPATKNVCKTRGCNYSF